MVVLFGLVVTGALVTLGVRGADTEWEVPWAIPWMVGTISQQTSWSVQIGHLWVTPARRLRAQDVMIQIPLGGRLHVETLTVDYRWAELVQRRGTSQWRATRVHLDPGSWKIRRAAAVELLSAGPVVEELHLQLTMNDGELWLDHLRVLGWALRGHGAVRWRGGDRVDAWVRGQVAGSVLDALGMRRVRGTWVPFEFGARGRISAPAIRFKTKSFSIAFGREASS